MKIDNVFKIIKFVESSSIKEFSLEIDGAKMHIVNDKSETIKNNFQDQVNISYPNSMNIIKDENIYNVKSPIIGNISMVDMSDNTYYVTKGTKVKKGDVLCTIEAMKLINEVVSEVDGEVLEILIEEGSIVEYGQTIFKIKFINN